MSSENAFKLPPFHVEAKKSFINSVKQCFLMALDALESNKMRTVLTMLGIIIGVASVIALVSIGIGVKTNIAESFSSLGSNMLIITPGASDKGGPRQASGSMTTLKTEDADAIKDKIKNIDYVSPSVSSAFQIVNGNQNWNSTVSGITPELMQIRSLTISSGSFITKNNLAKRDRVAVIGATVAKELFGEGNPVGADIRIKNQPFKVIGLVESKGQSSMGQDQDDIVYIPLTTAQERMIGITHVQSINVQVSSPDKVEEVQAQIENLLRQRHKIRSEKDDDFTVNNLTSLMEMMNQSTSMMTLFLGAIAGISLIVGGIGIMNIMMVSVTERTKEIGIRKALGATYNDIMMQFMIESMVIGVIGGIIGIGIGLVLSNVISKFGDFKTVVTIMPILLSFSFAVGVGLFFGIYPAQKAAKLDPIEALRYE